MLNEPVASASRDEILRGKRQLGKQPLPVLGEKDIAGPIIQDLVIAEPTARSVATEACDLELPTRFGIDLPDPDFVAS